ncbi:MAG: hypothetical protein AAF212_07745 [Verrucomicrobiota bacterium]
MGENPEQPPQEKKAEAVDLSSLKDLSFTPDWGSSKGSISTHDKKGGDRGGSRSESKSGGGAARKDRRPPRRERPFEKGGDSGSKGAGGNYGGSEGFNRSGDDNRRGGKRFDKTRPPMFRPTVEVNIYPEDEPFKVLVKAIRSSYRTYELFDIARLIIEKPERFVAVVRPLSGKEAETQLYLSTKDNAVFEGEDAAISHAMQNAIETDFEVEQVEIDPPSGNFQMVNRCGLTGELLGPPNYHKYQEYLNEHYSTRIHNMSMERFLSKIEAVRDPEVVQEWIAKVSKASRYTLKADNLPDGEEALKFYGTEEVRRYIASNKKDELIKKVSTARVPGAVIEKLPEGNILKSIRSALDHQRKFPLDTANHLRARLRRLNFNIYKKGSKGISFVCVVKRKFRDENTKLAEAADTLINFIERNPNIAASELPKEYLGFELPKAPEPPAEGETPAEASGTEYTSEQHTDIRSLKQNLRWLISEGYVTEYSDGKLFAPQPMVAPKPKAKPEEVPTPSEDQAATSLDSATPSEAVPTPSETLPVSNESDATEPVASEVVVSEIEHEAVVPPTEETSEPEVEAPSDPEQEVLAAEATAEAAPSEDASIPESDSEEPKV